MNSNDIPVLGKSNAIDEVVARFSGKDLKEDEINEALGLLIDAGIKESTKLPFVYKMSLQEMIFAGGYYWYDPRIPEVCFSSGYSGEVLIPEIYTLERGMSKKSVLLELEKLNYRSANPQEFLHLKAAHSAKVIKAPIFTLCNEKFQLRILVGGRYLNRAAVFLNLVDEDFFRKGCCLAVVQK
mgnify:CR=1 FL=1